MIRAALARGREEGSKAAAASVERVRDDVRGLLDGKQVLALTSILERQLGKPVALVPTQGGVQVLLPTAELDRAMKSWSLRPAADEAVRAAVAAHRQRVSVLATETAALRNRLEPILTASELADLTAAIRRHRPPLLASAR